MSGIGFQSADAVHPRYVAVAGIERSDSTTLFAGVVMAFCLPVSLLAIGPVPLASIAFALIAPCWLPSMSRAKTYPVPIITLAACLLSVAVCLITTLDGARPFSIRFASVQFGAIFGSVVTFCLLFWLSEQIGARRAVVVYCSGLVLDGALTPESWADNPWKYSFAWPVALLLLTLVANRNRAVQCAVLLTVCAVSVYYDFRSFAGLCLLAIAVTGGVMMSGRTGFVKFVLMTVVAGTCVALIGSWLALSGSLGAAIQVRTQAQTQGGALSIITGARPELNAGIALSRHLPMGLGPGVEASERDIRVARQGLAGSGADLDSTYLNSYVLGPQLHLHSIYFDLFLVLGPLGVLAALLVAAKILNRLHIARAQSHFVGGASLLAVVALWDLALSPLGNLPQVVAAFAVISSLATIRYNWTGPAQMKLSPTNARANVLRVSPPVLRTPDHERHSSARLTGDEPT